MCIQPLNLSFYAVQRSDVGRWLLRAPNADPFLPAVCLVAAVDEPDYAGGAMKPLSTSTRVPQTRAEIGNINWREDLLQIARLLDRLAPDRHDPELFFEQRSALAHELRRLARWATWSCWGANNTGGSALLMVQFDPEHLRIAAKLREQERQRWRKRAVERALAFMIGLLISAALLAMPLVLWLMLFKEF